MRSVYNAMANYGIYNVGIITDSVHTHHRSYTNVESNKVSAVQDGIPGRSPDLAEAGKDEVV